jgi:hypothetical protein
MLISKLAFPQAQIWRHIRASKLYVNRIHRRSTHSYKQFIRLRDLRHRQRTQIVFRRRTKLRKRNSTHRGWDFRRHGFRCLHCIFKIQMNENGYGEGDYVASLIEV